MKTKDIVYLSGKISDPSPEKQKENLKKFFKKAEELKGMWEEIVNPAEWETSEVTPWEVYLARDLQYIFENKPDIFMLKNWEDSKGAKLERALGKLLGLSIFYEVPFKGLEK
jgi:hypothetical protein